MESMTPPVDGLGERDLTERRLAGSWSGDIKTFEYFELCAHHHWQEFPPSPMYDVVGGAGLEVQCPVFP